MMAAEAEFDREATQMLRNMGLEHNADTLNFFLSNKSTSGSEKWKEVLRKPSPPSLKRSHTGESLSQRELCSGGMELNVDEPRLSTGFARSKLQVPRANSSALQPQSYSYGCHQPVTRAKSVPESGKRKPGDLQYTSLIREGGRSLSPPNRPVVHMTPRTTAADSATHNGTATNPTTVKVKSSLIPRPMPAHFKSKPAAGPSTKTGGNYDTRTPVALSSTSGTKVLHSSKPSLKILSVTTSTSTKLQSVADCSLPRHQPSQSRQRVQPAVSHDHLSKSNKRYSTPALPLGAPKLQPPSMIPVHVSHAYDRLEGYQQMRLSLPESENTSSYPCLAHAHTASPTRSSSVNSDASQGSNTCISQKSIGSGEKRSSSPNSELLKKSSSNSRTPTPTIVHSHISKSTSNSSGEFYCATNDDSALNSKNTGNVNLHTPSPCPRPDITVSELATSTAESLNTLLEVITPSTCSSREHHSDSVPPLQVSITDHHSSSKPTSPSDTVGSNDIPQAEIEHVSIAKSYSSDDCSQLHPQNLKESTIEPPTVERVSNHIVNSGKRKTSIPTASKTSLPFPSKQKRVTGPPPVQKPKKPPPLSPLETGSSLLSPPVSYSKTTKHSTAIPSTTKKCLAGAPYLNEEQHLEPKSDKMDNVNISLEDGEDFFGCCHRCDKAVVGEESGCLALGKVFHTGCFKCSKCYQALSGKTFYTVGTDILCEIDYKNMLQRCCFCNQRIKEKVLKAFGVAYHPDCFRCTECSICLDGVPYAGESYDKVYCIKDYNRLHAPLCASCGDPIIPQPGKTKNIRVIVKDKYYHIKCYKCEDCGKLFASTSIAGEKKQKSVMVDGHLFCQKCYTDHLQGCVRTTV